MNINIAAVLATMAEVGANLPAYKALFAEVVAAFDDKPDDQAQLKEAYAAALKRAEDAHRDAQSL